jgi:group I intron endonuclease
MAREKASGVYCIENIINGMKYIGKGTDVIKRMLDKHQNCRYLVRAIEKYGEENFKRYIIEYCDVEKISEMEIFYIKEWETKIPNGYNLTDGGEGSHGWHATDETRKNMSENRKGRHHSQETKDKMSISRKKVIMTEERKANISKGKKGKKRSLEAIKASSDARRGIKTGKTSKYNGVCKDTHYYKSKETVYWKVCLRENGKAVNFGSYKTEEEAAKAYDKYIIEHKLLNPLNFPEDYLDMT